VEISRTPRKCNYDTKIQLDTCHPLVTEVLNNNLIRFERMGLEKISPDVSAYEYFIKTYCQFLQVDEAWNLIEEMEQRLVPELDWDL